MRKAWPECFMPWREMKAVMFEKGIQKFQSADKDVMFEKGIQKFQSADKDAARQNTFPDNTFQVHGLLISLARCYLTDL